MLDFTEKIEINNFIMKLLAKTYLKNQQKRHMKDLEKRLNYLSLDFFALY